MIGRDSSDDMDAYGLAPWLVGIGIAAFLIWLMFALSLGFA